VGGVRYRILGPVELAGAADDPVVGPREREVLAILLLSANRVVPTERLIDAMWPTDPPATARRQIHNCVWRLRRYAEITADRPGYRLTVADGELDVERFRTTVARAAAAPDPATAAGLYRSALAEWRGPALAGCRSDVARAAAVRLDEERLVAFESRVDAELRLGRHREVLGELAETAQIHPLRERAVAYWMLALHRSGRRGEAVTVYHELRARLDEQLGVAPGTQVRAAYLEILRADGAAGPPEPAEPAVTQVPAQLPLDVTGFVGRLDELSRLDRLAAALPDGGTRVWVVAGAAGVGKTAFAVRWADSNRDRFPDGQLYLDLRGYAPEPPLPPIEALSALLQGLGVPAQRIPVRVDGASGLLRSMLKRRRVLVILDNARDAGQVRALLPGGAGVAVVTSRDRLTGLAATHDADITVLQPLPPADARTLLDRMLSDRRAGFTDGQLAVLTALCGGLPLALRIVAANLAAHPDRYSEYTTARGALDLSTLEVDGDPEVAVRTAFDRSYEALAPLVRRVFRFAGLIPAPTVEPAAVVVLTGLPGPDVEAALRRLADTHLLERRTAVRYAFHDLIRSYAWGRAEAEDPVTDRERALARLLDRYLGTVDAATRRLYPHVVRIPGDPSEPADPAPFDDDRTALAWLTDAQADLLSVARYAVAHGSPRVACLLADRLRGYFWARRDPVDWIALSRLALAAAGGHDRLAETSARLNLGYAHQSVSDYDEAVEHYRAAATCAEEADWPLARATAFNGLGQVYMFTGREELAADHMRRALDLVRESGFRRAEASVLMALGGVLTNLGRLDEALAHHRAALELAEELGDTASRSAACTNVGVLLRDLAGMRRGSGTCVRRWRGTARSATATARPTCPGPWRCCCSRPVGRGPRRRRGRPAGGRRHRRPALRGRGVLRPRRGPARRRAARGRGGGGSQRRGVGARHRQRRRRAPRRPADRRRAGCRW
jgi:DNA-binding SARP family transcriptional activator/tetratricopeptide (TPR) repeat protein